MKSPFSKTPRDNSNERKTQGMPKKIEKKVPKTKLDYLKKSSLQTIAEAQEHQTPSQ
jgi:hypothetical protein